MNQHSQDRRRDPRVTHWSPLILIDGEHATAATLQNLSMAGVGCTAALEYALGRSLTVRLELPAEEDTPRNCLELPAQVVRCNKLPRASARPRFHLGLAFGTLDAHQAEVIAQFIQLRLPVPVAP